MTMLDAQDIARFTGPYNLLDGTVPVIDGVPRWPWDEAVARRRLGQVARLAGLLRHLTDTETPVVEVA